MRELINSTVVWELSTIIFLSGAYIRGLITGGGGAYILGAYIGGLISRCLYPLLMDSCRGLYTGAYNRELIFGGIYPGGL